MRVRFPLPISPITSGATPGFSMISTFAPALRSRSAVHDAPLLSSGSCAVSLHLTKADNSETVIELPEQLRVASDPELLQTVEQLFGNRVTVSPMLS